VGTRRRFRCNEADVNMRLKYSLSILILFSIFALGQSPAGNLRPSAIVGAKVESITPGQSAHTANIRIRNLADKDITAFSLALRVVDAQGKQHVSGTIQDILPGIEVGRREGIHPGAFFDYVTNISDSAGSMTAELSVVVFSDTTAEFTDREMLMQIMAERKAVSDAAKQTADIIHSSSSKAEAIAKLTQAWEEARYNRSLTASLLRDHLYNLQNQRGDSEADQQQRMAEYADRSGKEAEFFLLHAGLHGRTQ